MSDRDKSMLEYPEKMCVYCCNFDKEHIGMDCTALCKLTMTLAYAEDYGGNCMFYNVTKEQIIVPPCKVGDTVYSLREVSCEDIDEVHTVCEHYGFGTDDRICTLEKPQKCPYRYRIFKCLVTEYNLLSFARVWGKTVFLTKEEAERELKKRSEENACND